MPTYNDLLIPDQYYHIFNRAVGDEKMFRTAENYHFFLKKFNQYIPPVATLYCYCLLPNHFHMLIKIKSQTVIEKLYERKKRKAIAGYDNKLVGKFIMEQFSNQFNSYTKSFNKVYERKGKLFMDHLKRSEIKSEAHFTKIIHYIHANPVHHGYCPSLSEWQFSSYRVLQSNAPTLLPRDEIFEWFGSREAFIRFHQQPIEVRP